MSASARYRCSALISGSRARTLRLSWLWLNRFGKYLRRCQEAKRQKSRSLLKRGQWARIASVRTSLSESEAGRPGSRGAEEHEERLAFHQSSTRTYNETRKESRSIMWHRLLVEVRCQDRTSAPSPLVGITHQSSKPCPLRIYVILVT